MTVTSVSTTDEGGTRSLGRKEITVGQTEQTLIWYRTDGTPTIFAGFHTAWMSGEVEEHDLEFALDLGMMTPYLLLKVRIGDRTIYEYADLTPLLQSHVDKIFADPDAFDPLPEAAPTTD